VRRILRPSILPPGKRSAEERRAESGVGDGRDACAGASPLGSFVFKFGVVCLLGFATLNAGMVWQVRESIAEGYGDFASFYTAGQIVRSRQSARLYDPVLQWKIQQHFASKVTIRLGPFPYVRPPFEALLFLPLAHLSYPAACALWMGLQIILLLMAPLLLLPVLGRTFDLHAYAVQALVCLAFCPVGFSLVQGQDSVVLLLILIVALGFLLRGADYSCGAVLGLGLFKFHLVIPLFAILMLRKKWRAGVGFVAVAAVLVAISLIMVGWSGLLTYPKYLWGLNQAPGLGMVKPQSMPNVRGLLTVLLGNAALPVWANLFLAAIVVAGVIFASRLWHGADRTSIMDGFCLWIAITLATSYYANSYDLTLLLIPLLLVGQMFWRGQESSGWPRVAFLGTAGLLLCTPLLWCLTVREGQFRWVGLLVLGLVGSMVAAEKAGRRLGKV